MIFRRLKFFINTFKIYRRYNFIYVVENIQVFRGYLMERFSLESVFKI